LIQYLHQDPEYLLWSNILNGFFMCPLYKHQASQSRNFTNNNNHHCALFATATATCDYKLAHASLSNAWSVDVINAARALEK
jgi:hypothetical protein